MRDMIPAAVACGIGFTVSFLIASLAYKNAELSAEARFGVLVASLIAAAISGVLLSVSPSDSRRPQPQQRLMRRMTNRLMVMASGSQATPQSHHAHGTPRTLADGTASVEIDFRH